MHRCSGCGKQVKGMYCRQCRSMNSNRPKPIPIKACAQCRRYFSANKWKGPVPLKEVASTRASHALRGKVEDVSHLPEIRWNPGIKEIIEVEAVKQNKPCQIQFQFMLTLCPRCSKAHTQYFEGTLQLRNTHHDLLAFVENKIQKAQEKGIYATKRKEVCNGIDIRITDQNFIQNLGKQLVANFGGEMQSSPTLFTKDRQTSKKVYRTNVVYRAPSYKPGDIIKVDEKLIQVRKPGKVVHGTDVRTGKSAAIDLRKKTYTVLAVYKTMVTKVQPELEVLHPKTYQSVRVENPGKVKAGDEVRIVLEDGVYIVKY